jgi:secretion/DNA translocation related CpaE-like protein
VALVSRTALTDDMWRCALALGAERVAVLPADESMVLEWLVEVADVRVATGFVVGVVGGGGGSGASTLAAGLARAAVSAGDEAVLIDLDPLGGGLELLMGCEDLPGLRWPEVVATRGRISPTALRGALPVDDGVAVLSSPRSMIEALPVAGVREAIQAARRAGDLVVMDLPRHRDGAGDAAVDLVDCVLVLATADVRGAAATACQVGSLVSRCDDVRLVVRVARWSVVAADDVAASAGVPLAGTIPTVRGLTRQVSEGLGPPRDGRLGRALRRLHGHLTSTRRGS